ncbi:hypothetical protein [Kitasatospora sp. GAS204B]|uniref:hypothetical protein n=1 Tax=unclassified Kitasatospora TaxID=2633591 RepID=UPI0024763736|nr:hypothetical protein [Kitasatospora sp. GAS204B]MDH6117265.1 3-hydroxymyristoyl/3-hydroxydecanoyl-(acyl carrier protein) dehydratase [Kitasatospora sp. GAS204B]
MTPRVLGAPLTVTPVADGHGGWSAELELDPDWPIFAEHFPGNPMFPGSLTVRLMSALAESALGAARYEVREVRFGTALVPPAVVRLRAVPDPARTDTLRCQVLLSTTDGETVAARGEVTRHVHR